jgi:hypothetical protein
MKFLVGLVTFCALASVVSAGDGSLCPRYYDRYKVAMSQIGNMGCFDTEHSDICGDECGYAFQNVYYGEYQSAATECAIATGNIYALDSEKHDLLGKVSDRKEFCDIQDPASSGGGGGGYDDYDDYDYGDEGGDYGGIIFLVVCATIVISSVVACVVYAKKRRAAAADAANEIAPARTSVPTPNSAAAASSV